ncbi:DUF5825 family protein [Streptomyces sp. NPDC060027]|uniref:DUF5825 family protein n=1 Tax=Streptomyces sp. NPDC060027 TaxID=3347040 RepID=UPI003680AAAB
MIDTSPHGGMSTTAECFGLGPRREVVTNPLDISTLARIDMAEMAMKGCNRLEVVKDVELGRDTEFDIRFLHLLRQASTYGVWVSWHAAGLPDCSVSDLHHLPPPQTTRSESARSAVERWRDEYTYGLCYYRKGPGFWQVRDARAAGRRGRFTLGGERVIQLLERLDRPTASAELLDASELLPVLYEAHLTVQIGDWLLLLPHRLQRWPIPAYSI